MNVEEAVKTRYSEAAKAQEPSLCCPISYDPKLLEVIPQEVIDRDYGCGNPAVHVKEGETVLDLGSGSGKACFMVSQVVGAKGKVIGIDMNDEMLSLARSSSSKVAKKVGFSNVEFRKGKIQDLSTNIENPGKTLVDSESIDVVISNCVLNLVRPEDKRTLFAEIFRTLKRGGRVVISDIVSDEDVPDSMQENPELWSGCISGSFREDLFLKAFEEAGFYGISILERQAEPWQTVEGIEFRSITVVAYKGKEGACFDQKHAVIYRGPFQEVVDDDGHILRRGVRTAVCEKTYKIYSTEPYRSYFELVPPRVLIPLEKAPAFPCSKDPIIRDPSETKGKDYRVTTDVTPATCGTGSNGKKDCC